MATPPKMVRLTVTIPDNLNRTFRELFPTADLSRIVQNTLHLRVLTEQIKQLEGE